MNYFLLMILWLVPSVVFSQSEWTREDRIAENIKGVKTAAQLIAEIESHRFQDEWSKVRIAFKWIERNIRYDWGKYRSGSSRAYAPDETIEKRLGVCSDYAQLFKCVLDSLGFENEVITGNAKGYGYQQGDAFYYPDHAWNAVRGVSGKWHLFDVTWGSFYFDLDPSIMIYDHLPLNRDWQLMDTVVSKSKFEAMSVLPRWFIQQGISMDQIKGVCPSDECELVEIFKIPEISILMPSKCLFLTI
jgi:transglutaminase/protease-like cytokinesis protein 3